MTPEEVEHWLQCHRFNGEYYDSNISEAERRGDRWIQIAHGAKILETIFEEFSEFRVEYDKVKYGLALTEWLLEHAQADLTEVADVIANKLEPTSLIRH